MRAARGPQHPTRRSFAVSLAAHGLVVLVALLASRGTLHRATVPIQFAVQPSLFSAPTAPPTAASPVLPAVAAEDDADAPQPTVVDVNPTPLREPAHAASPADAAPPPAARTIDARLLRREVTRRAVATPTSLVPPPLESAAPPAAPAARPEVLSPLPGHDPAPDYPAAARARRIEGTVVVRIDVAADGSASSAVVAQSSGSVLLDAAARRAALRWRFHNGPGRVDVPFVFRLMARS